MLALRSVASALSERALCETLQPVLRSAWQPAIDGVRRAASAAEMPKEARMKAWQTRLAAGEEINPCQSRDHPAVQAGLIEASDEQLSLQESYSPWSRCFGCGAPLRAISTCSAHVSSTTMRPAVSGHALEARAALIGTMHRSYVMGTSNTHLRDSFMRRECCALAQHGEALLQDPLRARTACIWSRSAPQRASPQK